MRIGIVTIADITNYGNRLQNYAMHDILTKKKQSNVMSLVAKNEKKCNNGNYLLWIKEQISRLMCINPAMAEKRFGNNVTRWANFVKWNKLVPTKTYYECARIPNDAEKEFDYFIAGSDQVWNYHFSSHKFKDYFLEFTESKKKIAVSASFGVEEIPDEWKQIYTKGLKDFAHISVREDAGAKIVKELIGRDVPVLIDPTMMLSKEEWLKVSCKPRVDCSKPYILKYYLGDENKEDSINVWAKENGYEVYELLNDKIPELYSAGPGEFISLISNASMVCSDSFHCIVFSIIFSKPFIVYARRGKENYMTSRLDTLLGKFGFQNRWKHMLSEEEYLACDYSKVPELLEEEQKKFIEYISNAIK